MANGTVAGLTQNQVIALDKLLEKKLTSVDALVSEVGQEAAFELYKLKSRFHNIAQRGTDE